MNSLGAVIGLTMCFLPLQEVWPLSVLGTQLRATFVMCIGFIMTSNLFTMTIDEWMEEEIEEEDDEDDAEEGEDEEGASETAVLLQKAVATPGSATSSSSKMRTVQEGDHEHHQHDGHTEIVIHMPIALKAASGEADEAEGEDEAAEEEEEEAGDEPAHMSLLTSLLAFRLLPPALVAIWVTQFTWWLVIMQCSFWWTTWVGIAVFGGDPLTSPDVFYEGVTYGIIGTLVHSIVSFFSSHVLTKANNTFGVTRVYHASAVIYSIATAALWWWRSKEASMVYMIGTGFFYPVINTNPFILIEVYTGYDEAGEEEGEAEAEGEGEDEEVEAEAGKVAGDEMSATKAVGAMNHSSPPKSLINSPSEMSPAGGLNGIGRLSLDQRQTSDLPYESHTETETDSGSSSSSSSSDSEADSPLGGAQDSVSESEGSMSEEELAAGARSSMPRELNLSQYGYDMSTSLNEAYPFSDGEVVQGGVHGRPLVASDQSPSLSAYGSPLPLSSLLPLALESAAHPQPSSPHSPHSPDSPLTPLLSPGMVATVAAQHAQGTPMIPTTSSRLHTSDLLATGMDSSAQTTPTRQPRSANRSSSQSFSQQSPTSMSQNNLTRRRPHPALSIGAQPDSGSDAEEKSQLHPRAQSSSHTAVPAMGSPPSAALSIRSLLQQSGLSGTSSKEEKHSPPTHPSATSSVSSPNSPRFASLATPTTNKAASTTHLEGEDEAEAEEELEEAEEAEAEYLKASTHRGVLTAIMNLSMGLSQIISATLGGVLISWWGDITIVFVMSGVLCVIVNLVVVTYGLSSVRKTVAVEEEGEDEKAEEVELHTVRSEDDVEARVQQQEIDRKRKQDKREDDERKRVEVEAQRIKDRDRILRRFMRQKDAAEHEHKTYGSVASAGGIVEQPATHRRHRRHRHHHKTDDSVTSASLPTSASLVPGAAPAVGSSHRRHRRRSHRHRDREGSVVEFDRQHAQTYLMHALAAMSRMHSSHGQPAAAASKQRAPRPGIPAAKRAEHEHTPLLTASSVLSPPPLVHAATTGSLPPTHTPSTGAQPSSTQAPTSSSSSSAAGGPHGLLTSLLSHPSHQRLLYEITVLLHYYHVHHISLLPVHVQDRILARLAKHIRRHRRSHHHRIDADITSRRGLSGRYAMGEEVRMERERLHLIDKRRRRRIRRKEREMRDKLQGAHGSQASATAALSSTP